MVDDRLLTRLDWLLALLAGWFLLSLVVACFALMLFDTALGVLALATVVLTVAVAAWSFFRSTGTEPDVTPSVR